MPVPDSTEQATRMASGVPLGRQPAAFFLRATIRPEAGGFGDTRPDSVRQSRYPRTSLDQHLTRPVGAQGIRKNRCGPSGESAGSKTTRPPAGVVVGQSIDLVRCRLQRRLQGSDQLSLSFDKL